MSPDDPQYVFMPEGDVLKAKGLVDAIHDAWWCVHPEKGLRLFQRLPARKGKLVGAAPQCNRDRTITERYLPAGDVMKQIPLVLIPINVADYS